MTSLEGFTLVNGAGDGRQTACLMSARSLLDGRPFGDNHPSAVLKRIGIRINDGPWWESNEERTFLLLPLALDERLCASKCDASREAELKRAKLVSKWALSFAVPMALDCAADALRKRWPESAMTLRQHGEKLRRAPTQENARAAQRDANTARQTAAAAYAAAAADSAAYAADYAAYAAVAYAADVAYVAYADVAYAAAVGRQAAQKARAEANRKIRDSLIELFGQLLDVRSEVQS